MNNSIIWRSNVRKSTFLDASIEHINNDPEAV